MKKKLFIVLTIVVIPFLLALYFIDRAVTIILPWMDVKPIQKWMLDAASMTKSIIRVATFTLIYCVYLLFTLIL